MVQFYRQLLLIVTIVLCLPTAGNTASVILGFRTADKEDYSRFVLDVSDRPIYQAFTLENPNRLVLDLQESQWLAFLEPHEATKRIKEVRHAFKPDGSLRIVVDTNQPIAIKNNYVLEPKQENTPYRLVVDLVSRNQDADNHAIPTVVTKKGTMPGVPTPVYKKRRKPIIVIDAGHGGRDPGAIGRKGTKEKNITLAYAKELKKQLLNTKQYSVVLTRSSDRYIKLRDRVKIAERSKGDLFVSLHADAHKNSKTRGLSVYTLSEKASDKEAAALAKKENYAGVIDNINIETQDDEINALLIDLVQRETKNVSADFAETLISQMKGKVRVLRNTHRFAGFRVLTGAKVPSVLIELGYLSNRREEKQLKSKRYKKKLAKALVKAIDSHFSKYRIDG